MRNTSRRTFSTKIGSSSGDQRITKFIASGGAAALGCVVFNELVFGGSIWKNEPTYKEMWSEPTSSSSSAVSASHGHARASSTVAASDSGKPQVVFVLGGPGAGKGTNCQRIVDDFGFIHLSAGDLLRAERKNPASEHGELINTYIKEGQIVPVEITVGLLKKAMEEHSAEGHTKFLVDGFPRNRDNLDGWKRVMGNYCSVEFVLFLTAPEDIMEERLLERGKTSGRADDNIESVRKRFKTFVDSSMPIVELYDAQDKVRTVQSHLSRAEVYGQVFSIMKKAGFEERD
jgi:UMP-CMP kinase